MSSMVAVYSGLVLPRFIIDGGGEQVERSLGFFKTQEDAAAL